MENEKTQGPSTYTVLSKVVYPVLVYVIGSLVILGGLFNILVIQNVPGIIVGIIEILMGILLMLMKKKKVYIAFCIFYGIGTIWNVCIFLFFIGVSVPIICLLFIRVALFVGLVERYTYIFGSKVADAEVARLLLKGIKAEVNGNYEEALTFYKKVVTEYPGTSQAEDAQSCIISFEKRKV